MAAEATAHAHHPTTRDYVRVAIVLGVLTAVETSTYFIDFAWAQNPILIVMMLLKFVVIVAEFMHLKFDVRLYRKFVYGGIILALFCYGIVFAAVAEIPAGSGL